MSFGFEIISNDQCVYVKISKDDSIILSLYTDDISLPGNNEESLETIKRWLSSEFDMKDTDNTNYILGIKILRDRFKRILGLLEEVYIQKILK